MKLPSTKGNLQSAFETKRLRVFRVNLCPASFNTTRWMFLAFRTDVDRPRLAVSMMVSPPNPVMPEPYIDWVETCCTERRAGLARELWLGIEKHLGMELLGDGATDEGEALCAAMDNRVARE